MKVVAVTIWQKTLALNSPYWLSGGRLRFDSLDSSFVRIECDDGTAGFGEGCPWGHTYLPAYGQGIRAAIELLAPVILGEDPGDIDRLNRAMDVQLPGHPYAKSAIDMALWDIAGKRAGQPLYQLLGGKDGDSVDVNSSISTGSPQEMVDRIEQARAEGYRVHSCKLGGSDPRLDIERCNAIDACLAPQEAVTYDINRAWTPGVAIQVMNSVASTGWFEQPCETLVQCADVRRHTSQPIMLDECMQSFDDHLLAWKTGTCQGVKVKPNRLGGITRSRQVRDFGVSVGWQMHVEDVGGTILADTASIHLALSTPPGNRLASWLCHPHLVDDYAQGQGARNNAGRIELDASAGIGVEPPEEWLGVPSGTYGI